MPLKHCIRYGVNCRYANLHSIYLFVHQSREKTDKEIVRNLSFHSLLLYSDAFQNQQGQCCEEAIDCFDGDWAWAGPKYIGCKPPR